MSTKGPKLKPLEKRVPRNPKYANVRSKIDTGASVNKYLERIEHIRSHYKYRKDEIFKRIKATTLAALVLEVAERNEEDDLEDLEYLDEAATFEPTYPPGSQAEAAAAAADRTTPTPQDDQQSLATARTDMTARSTLLSVIHGVGDKDIDKPEPPKQAPRKDPYLIVDLRDPQEYEQCHIVGAINFHHTRLSRATNSFTPELHEYINKPDRLLVLYDEDESIAHRAATIFVERGVDNAFLLSGGLKIMVMKFPEGMVVGDIPASCRPATKGGSRKTPSKSGAAAAGGAAAAAASPLSPGVLPLTRDNLDKIRQRLEENLLSDTASTTGSMTSRSTSRASSRAPSRGATPARGKPVSRR